MPSGNAAQTARQVVYDVYTAKAPLQLLLTTAQYCSQRLGVSPPAPALPSPACATPPLLELAPCKLATEPPPAPLSESVGSSWASSMPTTWRQELAPTEVAPSSSRTARDLKTPPLLGA